MPAEREPDGVDPVRVDRELGLDGGQDVERGELDRDEPGLLRVLVGRPPEPARDLGGEHERRVLGLPCGVGPGRREPVGNEVLEVAPPLAGPVEREDERVLGGRVVPLGHEQPVADGEPVRGGRPPLERLDDGRLGRGYGGEGEDGGEELRGGGSVGPPGRPERASAWAGPVS